MIKNYAINNNIFNIMIKKLLTYRLCYKFILFLLNSFFNPNKKIGSKFIKKTVRKFSNNLKTL